MRALIRRLEVPEKRMGEADEDKLDETRRRMERWCPELLEGAS